VKILVDTTYLLPVFGIEVNGLTDEDLLKIRELVLKAKIKLYCLSIIWIELIDKIYKASLKHRVRLSNSELMYRIRSLFNPKYYKWINSRPKSILIAYKLRAIGHKDLIDNLLYATSITRKMYLMAMDREFKEFLRSRKLNIENIISYKELFDILSKPRN